MLNRANVRRMLFEDDSNNREQATPMELKLFTDLSNALGKVVGGLKDIVNLPKAERETMRRMLDETYRLIDTALNVVIIRLGDILLPKETSSFLAEVFPASGARTFKKNTKGIQYE